MPRERTNPRVTMEANFLRIVCRVSIRVMKVVHEMMVIGRIYFYDGEIGRQSSGAHSNKGKIFPNKSNVNFQDFSEPKLVPTVKP